ncbi:hypothetical protein PEBR_15599 [Penicillium brasilianum]|uniref:Zn(2)-C6 fungal-type domain-containing protein n=1 Tax=Penicillium brasilianum TaxID=104259 RepID=A0A1S9RPZ3_PENBI|nr:hypothetical protein PEBR_15599 [Penicillium brasilianum]
MVYRGRPSRGCDECRVRKIKCDETRPTCSQCWVATRACPGYRDHASLIFQNETPAVIQKATGHGLVRHENSAHSEKLTPVPDHSLLRTDERVRSRPWPLKNLSPVGTFTEDRTFQATCFFLSYYSCLTISDLASDHLRQGILSETHLGHRALQTSIASVGLANLGNLYNSPGFITSAKRAYILALNEINCALQDPIQATQDTTLAAILCLSLYEIIIFERPQSLHAWTIHIQGATALLELRGEDQFRRQVGLHLFRATRDEVLLGCLQRGARLPEKMLLSPDNIVCGIRSESVNDFKTDLIEITAKLCNLEATIKDSTLQEARKILFIAEAIDSQLSSFASRLFTRFPYKVKRWSGDTSLNLREAAHISNYDGSFQIYTSDDACNLWNNYRCVRITVNRLIFKHIPCLKRKTLHSVENKYFEKQVTSRRCLLRQLAIEICLSVPFRLGLAGRGSKSITRPQMINPAAGLVLIFPLYLAAAVEGYPGSNYTKKGVVIVQEPSTYSHVKWIVSSRNWPGIGERLDTATQTAPISLELNEASVSNAIKQFIRHKVNELAEVKKYKDELRDTVYHLLSNSQGTFLWVALVCQELNRISRRHVLKKLKEFPPGLEDLYSRMIDQVLTSEDADLCKRILAVMSIVYWPITLEELAALVEMPDDLLDVYEALLGIVVICGSFPTLREDVLVFVHQSAEEFLLGKARLKLFSGDQKAEHLAISSRSPQIMFKTLQRNILDTKLGGISTEELTHPRSNPLAAVKYGNEATTVAYSKPEFGTFEDNNGRVTTKEVRQLINSLKEIITHQTTVIESTKAEILEVKHDQNVLQD